MADPFSVNCWAAIWVDMIHECMGAYGMGKGMFAPQDSLITIHEKDDMHFFLSSPMLPLSLLPSVFQLSALSFR